jgi:hypothetical protein
MDLVVIGIDLVALSCVLIIFISRMCSLDSASATTFDFPGMCSMVKSYSASSSRNRVSLEDGSLRLYR